jgi:hypothetical protein
LSKAVRKERVQIKGYILSTDFNRHGKVLDITLETDDFQQYAIAHNRKGKELFDCVLKEVIVTGELETKETVTYPMIAVQKYEIIS